MARTRLLKLLSSLKIGSRLIFFLLLINNYVPVVNARRSSSSSLALSFVRPQRLCPTQPRLLPGGGGDNLLNSAAAAAATTTTTNLSSSSPFTTTTAATTTRAVLLSVRGGVITATTTSSVNVDAFLNAMDLLGTAVFAFSGALTAGKKGMDILGMIIVATITSCGGGTVRDLLFQAGPAFWMKEAIYLQICVGVTFATYLFWPTLEQRLGWKGSEQPVCTADAVGLAAFAVLGAQKASMVTFGSGSGEQHHLHPLMWVVSGLMSACFGGVIRDLICLQRPRIMYPERTMYSPGPIIGSALYAALVQWTALETQIIASIAFLATFLIRVGSFNNPMRMPHWKNDNNNGK